MYGDEEKTSLWLTADERVIRSRSPPAVARSDGNMLLRTTGGGPFPLENGELLDPAGYLSEQGPQVSVWWRAGMQTSHSLWLKYPNKVNSQIWQDLLTGSESSSLHFTINCTFILEMWTNHRKENGDSSETQRLPDELTSMESFF